MSDWKKKTYRSEKYRKFVETQPCAVSESGTICEGGIVAHHMKPGRPKGTDLESVALCVGHHNYWHRLGSTRRFDEIFIVDLNKIAYQTLQRYVQKLETVEEGGE